MNISPDLHATQRRSDLRAHRKWTEQEHVRLQVRKEAGSPLPAILCLAAVCAVAWVAGFWPAIAVWWVR